jgi:pentatricopeptide repeat protein
MSAARHIGDRMPRVLASKLSSPAKKSRYFDPHTISIWATNIAARGGSVDSALKMLLGRVGRLRPHQQPPLYNTALDICGQRGMTSEAASILHRMAAANIRPNERAISSLLNSIAMRARALPEADYSSLVVDFRPGALAPEAFDIKNKMEAVDLAIKIYFSWAGHLLDRGEEPSIYPFNCLLKVLAVAKCAKALRKVFPVGSEQPRPRWVPEKVDIISFTNAAMACEGNFALALSYWEAVVEARRMAVDAKALLKVTNALLIELAQRRTRLSREQIGLRKDFLSKAARNLPTIDTPLAAVNNVLRGMEMLSMAQEASAVWSRVLLPRLEATKSFKKAASHISGLTVTLLVKLLLKAGKAQEGVRLIDQLRTAYGMHISTAVLNCLLKCHRRLKNYGAVRKALSTYLYRRTADPPNMGTLKEIVLAVDESAIGAAIKKLEIQAALARFKKQYPKVFEDIASPQRKAVDFISARYSLSVG